MKPQREEEDCASDFRVEERFLFKARKQLLDVIGDSASCQGSASDPAIPIPESGSTRL
jgi:hypothetical protein